MHNTHDLPPAFFLLTSFILTFSALAGCERESPDNPTPTVEATSQPPTKPTAQASPKRYITIGGAITETVAALGATTSIVGVDRSSSYPEAISALPKVGSHRKLNPEGILSLSPTDVFLSKMPGQQDAMEKLRDAGVRVHELEDAQTSEQAIARIKALGELVGKPQQAQTLAKTLKTQLERVDARRASIKNTPGCALFIYARGARVLMVSGTNTPAHNMLKLTGHPNCIKDFEGFKPLTPEAVIAAKPAFLVLPTHGAKSIGGDSGVLNLPGVAQTPAGRAKAIVTVDDLTLLGFGPRHAQALHTLQDGFGVSALAATP